MSKEEFEIVEFGDLIEGDRLVGSDGKTTEVTKAYDKHIPDRMFEIVMDDGETIRSSGNHLWYSESDGDVSSKETYREMAKDFFSNVVIPGELKKDVHYPLEVIVKLFGDRIVSIVFIEQACKSLGHSSVTPHVLLENKLKDVSEFEVNNYSYNDLIKFLEKMKLSVMHNAGYFYFGKVRTTEEIAKLVNNGMDVNIPHKSDIL